MNTSSDASLMYLERAFNNILLGAIRLALIGANIKADLVNWIINVLANRKISAENGVSTIIIIRAILSYGSIVWCPYLKVQSNLREMDKI